MIVLTHLYESLSRCGLWCRQTVLAQQAGPAAISRVLQLHDDSIGISEVQLRRTSQCTAEFCAAHSDARLQLTGLASGCNTVLGEDLHYSFIVEIVDRQAIVVNTWIITGTSTDGDEGRTVTNLEYDCIGLSRRDGHAEKTLVPRKRCCRIRHAESHMINRTNWDRWRIFRSVSGFLAIATNAVTSHCQGSKRTQKPAPA